MHEQRIFPSGIQTTDFRPRPKAEHSLPGDGEPLREA